MRTNATLYQYNCPTKGAGRVGRYIPDTVPEKKRRFLYYIHARLHVPYRATTIIVLPIALPTSYHMHLLCRPRSVI